MFNNKNQPKEWAELWRRSPDWERLKTWKVGSIILTDHYIDRDSDEETFSGGSGKHQRLKKLKVEGSNQEGEAPAPSSPQGEGFKIKNKNKENL